VALQEKFNGLGNSLSEETLKARKWLIAASIVSLSCSIGGFIPQKVSSLGIEFTVEQQGYFLYALKGVVIYHLCSFGLYMVSDAITFFQRAVEYDFYRRYKNLVEEIEYQENNGIEAYSSKKKLFWLQASSPIIVLRLMFDTLIPVFVAVFAFSVT